MDAASLREYQTLLLRLHAIEAHRRFVIARMEALSEEGKAATVATAGKATGAFDPLALAVSS